MLAWFMVWLACCVKPVVAYSLNVSNKQWSRAEVSNVCGLVDIFEILRTCDIPTKALWIGLPIHKIVSKRELFKTSLNRSDCDPDCVGLEMINLPLLSFD